MNVVNTSKKYNISKLPIIYLRYCINKMAVSLSKMPSFKKQAGTNRTTCSTSKILHNLSKQSISASSKNSLHTTKPSKMSPWKKLFKLLHWSGIKNPTVFTPKKRDSLFFFFSSNIHIYQNFI